MTMNTTVAWVPGGWEYVILGLVVLLLFGRRIPSVARSLGQSITQFRRGLAEGKEGSQE